MPSRDSLWLLVRLASTAFGWQTIQSPECVISRSKYCNVPGFTSSKDPLALKFGILDSIPWTIGDDPDAIVRGFRSQRRFFCAA